MNINKRRDEALSPDTLSMCTKNSLSLTLAVNLKSHGDNLEITLVSDSLPTLVVGIMLVIGPPMYLMTSTNIVNRLTYKVCYWYTDLFCRLQLLQRLPLRCSEKYLEQTLHGFTT